MVLFRIAGWLVAALIGVVMVFSGIAYLQPRHTAEFLTVPVLGVSAKGNAKSGGNFEHIITVMLPNGKETVVSGAFVDAINMPDTICIGVRKGRWIPDARAERVQAGWCR